MEYFEVPMEAIVPVDDDVMTAEAANSLSDDLGGFVVETAQTQQNGGGKRQQSTNQAVEVQQIHQEGQKILIVTNEVGEDDDLDDDQQPLEADLCVNGVTLAAHEPVGVNNDQGVLPAIDPDFESPFDQFVQDEVVVQADGNTEDYQAEVEVKQEPDGVAGEPEQSSQRSEKADGWFAGVGVASIRVHH